MTVGDNVQPVVECFLEHSDKKCIETTLPPSVCRLIRVYGIVQGVGFRPFVARIAAATGIAGSVCNKGPYVEIYAGGSQAQVDDFMHRLTHEAPERSAILKVETTELPPLTVDSGEFRIIQSEKVAGDVFVSPDIATCDKCRAELFDKNNKRYLHPFINCTACGPRLTILDAMPYDRVRTSMKDFPMCAECEWEYTTPSTRRYHAQPVCCPDCGPHLAVIHPRGVHPAADGEAMVMVRDVVRGGGIAAIKGIGGFHLCCDATNDRAVERLRTLKARPTKPFAVMMRDMDTVRRECEVTSEKQETILTGPNKPILLLQKSAASRHCERSEATPASESGVAKLSAFVAPGNPRVGVMLPYAPVQMLLFDYPDGKPFPDAVVMTSGNPRGAPICRTDEDAMETLSPMCDMILSNDRMIRLRADDSVMAWDDETDTPVMIRRSRGYAPLPVMLDLTDTKMKKAQSPSLRAVAKQSPAICDSVAVLAIGGELKNTFCLARGELHYLSPYIGDMADVRSVEALRAAIKRMERLLEITPQRIVCDKHPKYNTVEVAREIADERGIPLVQVQHHWAHVASCMAENGWRGNAHNMEATDTLHCEAMDSPVGLSTCGASHRHRSNLRVIGVAFDGTGYGDDGTIWGGEVLIADYKDYIRAASIEPFPQAGGDAAARQGWRIAAAMLDDEAVQKLHLASEDERRTVRFMIRSGVNTVTSTSCGRLFDAVGAILGLGREVSFEGEVAMRVQAKAEEYDEAASHCGAEGRSNHYKKTSVHRHCEERSDGLLKADCATSLHIMPTTALVREIAARRIAGEDAATLAYCFHDALADMVLSACEYCRRQYGAQYGLDMVALTGGVFTNTLLRSMCRRRLEVAGFSVMVHTMIPAGDGGIALGQAVIGGCREI